MIPSIYVFYAALFEFRDLGCIFLVAGMLAIGNIDPDYYFQEELWTAYLKMGQNWKALVLARYSSISRVMCSDLIFQVRK